MGAGATHLLLLRKRRKPRWSPLSLGSLLAAWYKADAGCYTDAACLFASASSQYLSKTSPTFAPTTKMTIAFDYKPTTVAADQDLVGQWASGNTKFIVRCAATGTVDVYVSSDAASDGGSNLFSTTAPVFSAGVNTRLVVVYDGTLAAANRVAVYADGSAVGGSVSGTIPAALSAGTAALTVGGIPAFTFANGALARLGFSSLALSGAALTAAHTSTFWADMTAARQADWFSFYNLCEVSSTRVDSTGLNNLTPTNGPTVAAGPGEGLCVDNSPIKSWRDQWTGGLHATASDITKQPLYKTGIQNSLPGALFDGTLSYLNAAVSLSQPISVFVVAKVLTAGGSSVRVFQSGNFNPIFGRHSTNKWSIYASSELAGSLASDASAHAFAMTFNGASSLLDVDGVSDITGDAGAGGMTSVNFSGTVGGGDIPANCYIHEIFFVSAASSAGVRAQATSYLRSRWGI